MNSRAASTGTEQSARGQQARLWGHIILFGIAGGLLITLLKWTEYRYVVVEHSIEIYGGLPAATFAAFGIWLGLRLTRKQIILKEVRVPVPAGQPFAVNAKKQEELGITPRELEILELIAKGMSNREIADKLFVGENTVKTHSSRVFDKLGAKRRTQAAQLGIESGLIPWSWFRRKAREAGSLTPEHDSWPSRPKSLERMTTIPQAVARLRESSIFRYRRTQK